MGAVRGIIVYNTLAGNLTLRNRVFARLTALLRYVGMRFVLLDPAYLGAENQVLGLDLNSSQNRD
jgi:hypothetical protein